MIVCAQDGPKVREKGFFYGYAPGHNYIGHNYMGHNYIGHTHVDHNYIGSRPSGLPTCGPRCTSVA